jgi:primosomal protein N' (replication factor Y)
MKRVPRVAEVLILRKARLLAEPFDYEVPSSFFNTIKQGNLVRVPLGRSEALGLVLRLKESSTQLKLKSIIEVLSGAPELKPYQLDLLMWLSAYYLESPGAVSTLFFPVGFPRALEKRVSILSRDAPRELYDLLIKAGGTASYKKLEQTFGVNRARRLLKEAVERDAVKVYWTLKLPPLKPKLKYEIYFADLDSAEKLERSTRSLRIRAFLQEIKTEGVISFEEAKEEFGLNLAILRKLESAGAVKLVERIVSRVNPPRVETFDQSIELTPEQKKAVAILKKAIKSQKGEEFLLFGPTGSGKTEVYLQAAAEALSIGYQVIYLVPEISLTPQTYSRIEKRFPGQVAIFHSGLKSTERLDEWFHVERGLKNIVVGARSALFLPLKRPGLIIIDEEHDTSYRQESSPVYDARRVAREIARLTGAVVVYGSATPSLERFFEAEQQKIGLLELSVRVSGKTPEVTVVNLRKEKKLLSDTLKKELLDTIAKGGQVLLFLNRRGYSVVEICKSCGYLAICPRCTVFLRYHKDVERIVCHYCGYSRHPDKNCPECGSEEIELKGRGIQQVEADLEEFLGQKAEIVRLDSDITRSGKSRKNLLEFISGKAQVLIGTQMITKGFHLPGVVLAAAINADVGLNLPDFRAGERTFQLIVQLMGRAGRGEEKGKVIVQTWQPERAVIKQAVAGDYRGFYLEELMLRRLNELPPFTFLIRILVMSKVETEAMKTAEKIYELLQKEFSQFFKVTPPLPAPLYKLHGRYRIQILLKSMSEPEKEVLDLLKKKTAPKFKGTRVIIEVDPVFVV